ncbi:LysR family transcriptional regulator [Sinomonas notoginsengisoli]|uniref:LysR substrate-binding domain-containing protein n=1 Tax=Sinomonas notoginsengisoli TaxID=1457311 RepID=UPI001F3855D5|nr:LysR substrate-binding domain-containing protein [Sinomonas notoginsengisoli]
MLEIRRLRLLRELSIRGTLAEVAEALAYSPSSVSQQLALLEKETGVELMRKSGRGVLLTPQAQLLVAHTEELLDAFERTEAALAASQSEVSGTVRLAVFQTAALALMPSALRALRERHPQLRVEMVQHEPETALRETWARSFDLVVAEQYPHHAAPHYEGLERQGLTRDTIRLAVPPLGTDAASDAVWRLPDAARLAWVMEPHGAASRHWAEQACRMAGFEPDVRYETADLQAHVQLVESGNAVALLPDLVWVGRTPGARLLGLEGAPQRSVFTAMRSSSTKNPVMRAVRQALEETAGALLPA